MTHRFGWGLLLPFPGTGLGAAMVLVLKDRISDGVQQMFTGCAAGCRWTYYPSSPPPWAFWWASAFHGDGDFQNGAFQRCRYFISNVEID